LHSSTEILTLASWSLTWGLKTSLLVFNGYLVSLHTVQLMKCYIIKGAIKRSLKKIKRRYSNFYKT